MGGNADRLPLSGQDHGADLLLCRVCAGIRTDRGQETTFEGFSEEPEPEAWESWLDALRRRLGG